ncbi:hypothetical protein D9M69_660800 [compost metagenome]
MSAECGRVSRSRSVPIPFRIDAGGQLDGDTRNRLHIRFGLGGNLGSSHTGQRQAAHAGSGVCEGSAQDEQAA